MRKSLAVGFSLISLLAGLSLATVFAQQQSRTVEEPKPFEFTLEPEPIRVLEPDTTAVRLLLGVGDSVVENWSGRVRLDKGEVLGADGWRLRQGDKITSTDSWETRSVPLQKSDALKNLIAKTKTKVVIPAAPKKQGAAKKAGDAEGAVLGALATGPVGPAGVILRLKAPEDAVLTVETAQGRATVKLADLPAKAGQPLLRGRIEARRVPTYAPLAVGPAQEDFPVAVSDGKDGAWVAIVTHEPRGLEVNEALRTQPVDFKKFVPEGGGDRIDLVHYEPGNPAPARRIDLTGPGHDLWRPAIGRDGNGQLVVVWAERTEGNWDLYSRTYDPSGDKPGELKRLTTDPGADADPVLATVKGKVVVAWQAWRNGQADILYGPIDDLSSPVNLSNHAANEWSPSIAAGPSGVVVAFDSYRNGNYDVILARIAEGSSTPELVPVAASTKFEARPTVDVDGRGRAWVAYEERSDNWGKDFGKIPDPKGAGLYAVSRVKVRVVDGARVLETADPVSSLTPREKATNSFPRLALDATGRPWLLYRHRQEFASFGGAVLVPGALWIGFATSLNGKDWAPPQPLPRSDNLLDNRPALVRREGAGLLAVYSSDGRLHREVNFTPDLAVRFFTHQGTPPGVVNDDVFIASLKVADNTPAPEHLDAAKEPEAAPPAHAEETNDVARIRGHRIQTGGKSYQLLRGEFHRHTEISFDGVADGSLEDMWRYAIDAGNLDWLGCGDHDNGGKEYTWWITQKTTDLYHSAPRFNPLFTYERSVQYPGGHRNVMFPYRGVRPLPRLVDENGVRSDVKGRDEDAEMLYEYLRELGGICASHTSATSMGTDWRANDPAVEPFVEIYQGNRDSYEHLGAPRVARDPSESIGGWRPLGQIWNALALQYRLGFQASSDHVSTHISFAIALAETASREGIFEAFKKRHCYAATDNIILDVRAGEHLMGDEFTANGPLTLSVFAHGTSAIKKVDIIKNFRYVYSTSPDSPKVDFRWTDDEPAGVGDLSWYYVRIQQDDGELAWGSPIWVHKQTPPK